VSALLLLLLLSSTTATAAADLAVSESPLSDLPLLAATMMDAAFVALNDSIKSFIILTCTVTAHPDGPLPRSIH
jgi:hypothetical protein